MALDTLFYIIQKNIRLVFRNWTSFVLLVLGPLLLILIVGIAFSGNDLHDIKIGIHAYQGVDVSQVVDSLVNNEVSILSFPRIDSCIVAMNQSIIHICADFAKDFEDSGKVTFYYDSSRYNLVRYILKYLQEQIAITSEEISIELARDIFVDIDSFVSEMKMAQIQVEDLRSNALFLRRDLLTTYNDVVYAREQFEPHYLRLKEAQRILNASVLDFSIHYTNTSNITNILNDLYALNSTLSLINSSVSSFEVALLPYDYSSTVFSIFYEQINHAHANVTDTIFYIENNHDTTQLSLEQTRFIIEQLDLIIGYLDNIYQNLLATETTLQEHITLIDSGVEDLNELSKNFELYIAEFSSISEEDAEKFLHPISASFIAFPPEEDITKIELIFPMLLVFMITFISILLSNMLVLNETHNPAYFRNFLVPINNFFFITGLFFTTIIIISFQIFVLFIVAYFSFGVNFLLNTPFFVVSVILTIIVFVEIGMIFGYIIRERQTSLLLSLFFSLILFFFSDIVFPLEIMPMNASFVAQFNPLVIAESIFRRVLFFGQGVIEQSFAFSVLCLYALFFGILMVVAYYWNRYRRSF